MEALPLGCCCAGVVDGVVAVAAVGVAGFPLVFAAACEEEEAEAARAGVAVSEAAPLERADDLSFLELFSGILFGGWEGEGRREEKFEIRRAIKKIAREKKIDAFLTHRLPYPVKVLFSLGKNSFFTQAYRVSYLAENSMELVVSRGREREEEKRAPVFPFFFLSLFIIFNKLRLFFLLVTIQKQKLQAIATEEGGKKIEEFK